MAYSYHRFSIGEKRITENDFFRAEPLLLNFTEIESGPLSEARTHQHPHMEFFYFKSGRGVFECDGRSVPIRAHDILIVNANRAHLQYSSDDTSPLVYYNFTADRLHIQGATDNGITENAFEHHSFENEQNDIYDTIQKILCELQNEQCDYYSKVQALFTVLLIDLIRLFQAPRAVSESTQKMNTKKLLVQTKNFIDTHYAENLSLEQLTRISLMQKSYFMHQFKKYFDTSPIKYLNHVRIENAKSLLINTDKPVTEIAADVGFNTPAYFSEMFLRAVGMTPSAYRARNSLF